jgi:rod shape-determining protein MreB
LALAARLGDPAAQLIPHAAAAMRGAGLPPGMPAVMVVDIGESRTQVSVMAEDTPVATATFELGGETWDGAIVRYLRREHALQIGPAMAEQLKLADGACVAAGRCLRRGVPRTQPLHAGELALAQGEILAAMAAAIRRVLEAAPAEVAGQVVAQGILLIGGGANLRGLDAGLRRETGLAFMSADQPAEAVLRGLALIAEMS